MGFHFLKRYVFNSLNFKAKIHRIEYSIKVIANLRLITLFRGGRGRGWGLEKKVRVYLRFGIVVLVYLGTVFE